MNLNVLNIAVIGVAAAIIALLLYARFVVVPRLTTRQSNDPMGTGKQIDERHGVYFDGGRAFGPLTMPWFKRRMRAAYISYSKAFEGHIELHLSNILSDMWGLPEHDADVRPRRRPELSDWAFWLNHHFSRNPPKNRKEEKLLAAIRDLLTEPSPSEKDKPTDT